MRAVSAEALQTAANWSDINTDPGYVTPGPLVDGHVLPQQAYDVFAAGKQMDIPILVGWNEQEFADPVAGHDHRCYSTAIVADWKVEGASSAPSA